jgi:predicted ATPase
MRRDVSIVVRTTTAVKKTMVPSAGWQTGRQVIFTNLTAANASKARFMAFDLAMSVPGHAPIDYHLAISSKGVGYEITDETLSQQRTSSPPPFKHIQSHYGIVRYYEPASGLVPPNWDYNSAESALSQVPKLFQEPEDFRKRLASSTHYHVLDVSQRASVRLPQLLCIARR